MAEPLPRARASTRTSSGRSEAVAATSVSSRHSSSSCSPSRRSMSGRFSSDWRAGRGVREWYRGFIADAPEEFGGFPAYQIAPPLPFIPEERHGDTFIAFVACWSGPIEQGESMLKPIHDVAPVVAEHVGAMPYAALNAAFDG